MPLTPQEVRTRSFRVVRKGYDPSTVEAFLEEVASSLELVRAAAREAVDTYAGGESHAVLQSARRASDEITKQAREECTAIWREAVAEAEQTRRSAQEAAAGLVEQARAHAARLDQAAAEAARAAQEELDSLREDPGSDPRRVRAEAEAEAHRVLKAAVERAQALEEEADRRAIELREAAEQDGLDMIEEAQRRQDEVQRYEQNLAELADAFEGLLEQMKALRTQAVRRLEARGAEMP